MKAIVATLVLGHVLGGSAALAAAQTRAPSAQEVAVIVHPANTAVISRDDIKRLFLGKKSQFADGHRAKPVYLAQGHQAREYFNWQVLRKSSSQIKAYWSKLIFTGKGMPPDAIGDVDDLLTLVASERSAIAYIDAAQVTEQVRVVAIY